MGPSFQKKKTKKKMLHRPSIDGGRRGAYANGSSGGSSCLWIAIAGLVLLAAAYGAYEYYQRSQPQDSKGSKKRGSKSSRCTSSDSEASPRKCCSLKRAGAFGALVTAVGAAGYHFKTTCGHAKAQRIDEEAIQEASNSSFFRLANPWVWLSACGLTAVLAPLSAWATSLWVNRGDPSGKDKFTE